MTRVPPRLRAAGRELLDLDAAAYAAVQATPTPVLDRGLARLSRSADRSALWTGVAAVLLAAGPRQRRAACIGLGAVAATSAVVNAVLKPIPQRGRPSLVGSVRTHGVRMPGSHSWPSGHAASAFAFSTAVGAGLPELDTALRLAATAVAYSRVHTGVHYPGDVIAGGVVGAGVGSLVHHAVRRLPRGRGAGGLRPPRRPPRRRGR